MCVHGRDVHDWHRKSHVILIAEKKLGSMDTSGGISGFTDMRFPFHPSDLRAHGFSVNLVWTWHVRCLGGVETQPRVMATPVLAQSRYGLPHQTWSDQVEGTELEAVVCSPLLLSDIGNKLSVLLLQGSNQCIHLTAALAGEGQSSVFQFSGRKSRGA